MVKAAAMIYMGWSPCECPFTQLVAAVKYRPRLSALDRHVAQVTAVLDNVAGALSINAVAKKAGLNRFVAYSALLASPRVERISGSGKEYRYRIKRK